LYVIFREQIPRRIREQEDGDVHISVVTVMTQESKRDADFAASTAEEKTQETARYMQGVKA